MEPAVQESSLKITLQTKANLTIPLGNTISIFIQQAIPKSKGLVIQYNHPVLSVKNSFLSSAFVVNYVNLSCSNFGLPVSLCQISLGASTKQMKLRQLYPHIMSN